MQIDIRGLPDNITIGELQKIEQDYKNINQSELNKDGALINDI